MPLNLDKTIERLFQVAFESSVTAFFKDSLCGWGLHLSLPQAKILPSNGDSRNRAHLAPENTDGVVIQETDNNIVIKIEVPHLKAESLYLEISGNILIVRGEQTPGLRPNRHSGWSNRDGLHFERLIMLPVLVRPGEIRAKLVGRIIKINIVKNR
jgi:HSP20 family molecular chaperone IbpA